MERKDTKTRMRKRLPDVRQSITHRAVIHGDPPTKFFLTVGLYEDGEPGEVFVTMDRAGSDQRGWANIFSILISLCLQSGVPLSKLSEKLSWQAFDPQGFTDCPEVRTAKSIPDYIIRFMGTRFAPESEKEQDLTPAPSDSPPQDDRGGAIGPIP